MAINENEVNTNILKRKLELKHKMQLQKAYKTLK